MRLYLLVLLVFCLGRTNIVLAQEADSLSKPVDSVTVLESDGLQVTAETVIRPDTVKKKIFQPDAKRAGLYSALIPGLGQIYNRQYWKLPIIYAAMGTTIYFVVHNTQEYQRYRKAYISRLSNGAKSTDEFQGILQTEGIKQYQDAARQTADMMTVFSVVLYAGQILEAISGAHLRNFDISRDLTMNVRPLVMPFNTVGLGLVVNFKK